MVYVLNGCLGIKYNVDEEILVNDGIAFRDWKFFLTKQNWKFTDLNLFFTT